MASHDNVSKINLPLSQNYNNQSKSQEISTLIETIEKFDISEFRKVENAISGIRFAYLRIFQSSSSQLSHQTQQIEDRLVNLFLDVLNPSSFSPNLPLKSTTKTKTKERRSFLSRFLPCSSFNILKSVIDPSTLRENHPSQLPPPELHRLPDEDLDLIRKLAPLWVVSPSSIVRKTLGSNPNTSSSIEESGENVKEMGKVWEEARFAVLERVLLCRLGLFVDDSIDIWGRDLTISPSFILLNDSGIWMEGGKESEVDFGTLQTTSETCDETQSLLSIPRRLSSSLHGSTNPDPLFSISWARQWLTLQRQRQAEVLHGEEDDDLFTRNDSSSSKTHGWVIGDWEPFDREDSLDINFPFPDPVTHSFRVPIGHHNHHQLPSPSPSTFDLSRSSTLNQQEHLSGLHSLGPSCSCAGGLTNLTWAWECPLSGIDYQRYKMKANDYLSLRLLCPTTISSSELPSLTFYPPRDDLHNSSHLPTGHPRPTQTSTLNPYPQASCPSSSDVSITSDPRTHDLDSDSVPPSILTFTLTHDLISISIDSNIPPLLPSSPCSPSPSLFLSPDDSNPDEENFLTSPLSEPTSTSSYTPQEDTHTRDTEETESLSLSTPPSPHVPPPPPPLTTTIPSSLLSSSSSCYFSPSSDTILNECTSTPSPSPPSPPHSSTPLSSILIPPPPLLIADQNGSIDCFELPPLPPLPSQQLVLLDPCLNDNEEYDELREHAPDESDSEENGGMVYFREYVEHDVEGKGVDEDNQREDRMVIEEELGLVVEENIEMMERERRPFKDEEWESGFMGEKEMFLLPSEHDPVKPFLPTRFLSFDLEDSDEILQQTDSRPIDFSTADQQSVIGTPRDSTQSEDSDDDHDQLIRQDSTEYVRERKSRDQRQFQVSQTLDLTKGKLFSPLKSTNSRNLFEKPVPIIQLLKFGLSFTNITTLILRYSQISTQHLTQNEYHFSHHFPRLTNLDLSENKLSGTFFSFWIPQNLQTLNLSCNMISDISDLARSCKKLKELNISNNKIEQLKYYQLPKSIEILDLSRNLINSQVKLKPLSLCGSLKSLNLQSNPVNLEHLFEGVKLECFLESMKSEAIEDLSNSKAIPSIGQRTDSSRKSTTGISPSSTPMIRFGSSIGTEFTSPLRKSTEICFDNPNQMFHDLIFTPVGKTPTFSRQRQTSPSPNSTPISRSSRTHLVKDFDLHSIVFPLSSPLPERQQSTPTRPPPQPRPQFKSPTLQRIESRLKEKSPSPSTVPLPPPKSRLGGKSPSIRPPLPPPSILHTNPSTQTTRPNTTREPQPQTTNKISSKVRGSPLPFDKAVFRHPTAAPISNQSSKPVQFIPPSTLKKNQSNPSMNLSNKINEQKVSPRPPPSWKPTSRPRSASQTRQASPSPIPTPTTSNLINVRSIVRRLNSTVAAQSKILNAPEKPPLKPKTNSKDLSHNKHTNKPTEIIELSKDRPESRERPLHLDKNVQPTTIRGASTTKQTNSKSDQLIRTEKELPNSQTQCQTVAILEEDSNLELISNQTSIKRLQAHQSPKRSQDEEYFADQFEFSYSIDPQSTATSTSSTKISSSSPEKQRIEK